MVQRVVRKKASSAWDYYIDRFQKETGLTNVSNM